MTTVVEIVSRWRSEKLDLMPGVTPLRFKEFEDKLAISLPQSFRYLYSLTGGTNGVMDDRLFSLWSFEEIENRNGVHRSPGGIQVCFGDYLIDSHRYYQQLSESAGEGPIVIDEPDEVVAENFDALCFLFLNKPEELRLSVSV